MWVLSRYADLVTALNDWQTFSSAKGNLMTELPNRAGATLGTTDPPRHDRLRGLIQHAFMKRNLESLAEPIRAAAAEVAAPLAGERQFDFIEDFSARFTVKVLFAVLGLPRGAIEEIMKPGRPIAAFRDATKPVIIVGSSRLEERRQVSDGMRDSLPRF
jgi:cytochrome P450